MVEEYDGLHCTACKQFTFLSLVCSNCGQSFCELHSPLGEHDCSVAKHHQVKQVCATKVAGGPSSSTASSPAGRCFQCGKSSLLSRAVPLSCSFCQKPVCLVHRHRFDHASPEAETIIAAERNAKKEVMDAADDESENNPEDDHSKTQSSDEGGGSCFRKLKNSCCLA